MSVMATFSRLSRAILSSGKNKVHFTKTISNKRTRSFSILIQTHHNKSVPLQQTLCNSTRKFRLAAAMRSGELDAQFNQAKENVGRLKEDPGNEVKLQMYALFKQATIGKCNAPKPGMMDFVGKAKWGAWNELGEVSQDEAKNKYIQLVNELISADEVATQAVSQTSAENFTELLVDIADGVYKITLNRPSKKNAINIQMYEEWIQALSNAANNSSIKIAAVTGSGDYYCSGNDLSNFMNVDPTNMSKMANNGGTLLERFVNSFIDFPKPLIGLVNGPAVGVSVTTLGLFDAVYASDTATFHTPFSALGQTPEGCSSVTFPRLMGLGRANEMLMFNKKLTAEEALACGLVCKVFPKDKFEEKTTALLKEVSDLPPNTMKLCKGLIRGFTTSHLHDVNKQECKQLVECWQSDECAQAIMNFFQSKSKL